MNPTVEFVANRLATLVAKHGGKVSKDGQKVSFPNATAAAAFNKEWMA